MKPPFLCRCLIRTASCVVPAALRRDWLGRWEAGLWNWWILFERGEVTSRAYPQLVRHCSTAFAGAFWLRFNRQRFLHWLRGPSFVLACIMAATLLLGILSRGFAVTRSLIAIGLGSSEEAVVVHAVPLAFALAVGLMVAVIGRLRVHGCGWRYWAFLIAKTLLLIVSIPLLWIEGGAWIRAHLRTEALRVLAGGIGWTLLFLAGFGQSILWSLADQRRRCPVCLRRLAMPVAMGSWASMFEPASTEMLCDEGHGSLCLSETESGADDRWIALDASWRELFETVTQTSPRAY
jgi:hypothetical protein